MKIVSIPTNFVLDCHAQRSEVVDLGLKSFNACDSFVELLLNGFNVSLPHLELMFHILLVNFELFLQAIGVDYLVANAETLAFK